MPKSKDYGEQEFERHHPRGYDVQDDLSQMLAEDAIARMMGVDSGDFIDNDNLSVAETGCPYVVTAVKEELTYDPEAFPEEMETELVRAAIERTKR